MQGEAVEAVRAALALFARDDLLVARVTGDDRVDFLQRVVSADVKKLEAGQGTPAALLTPKGRVVSSMALLAHEDALTLVVERECARQLLDALERYIVVDEVELVEQERAVLGLYGPRIAEHGQLAGLRPYQHRQLELLGESVLAMGDDHLAAPGVALICEPAAAARLFEALGGRGAVVGDAAAHDVCRIEAGTPRMGAELSQEVLILEAGQLAAIAFDKGCYIGQEPVCRVHSRGQVQRLLVGLRLEQQRVPKAGETLSGDAKQDAGRITSAATSPVVGGVIALAYVHRSCAAVGTRLSLAGGGQASVVSLPQVPSSTRPLTCPSYREERAA